ncbi:MAG: hypothetical protein PVH18_12305 [Chloroflexota bacterium]|jgi:hypothetical protein
MAKEQGRPAVHLDVLGLLLAGLINTFLAAFVAGIVLGPGTAAREPDLLRRIAWISDHTLRWQLGWAFWFAVTLSFAWSYYAIGRHLRSRHPWTSLAIGLAVIAAAVDIVGVLVYLVVLPLLAQEPIGAASVFQALESLANALVNVTAFGLYTVAGLLLVPAAFSTPGYPRWLVALGAAEWGIAALATFLLVIFPRLAVVPLLISFALYAPWVWASAVWLLRRERQA